METKNIHYVSQILITCICLLMPSCNSDKNERLGSSKNDDDSDVIREEKHQAQKSSGSFEEFVMSKNEIDLQIYSTRVDEIFDPEEAIELRVELFSPRFITYKTYQNTLGANQPKPQIDDLEIGSDEHPWPENLSIFYISGEKEVPISYATKHPSEQNVLNIGKGDIGSLGIILQPGILPQQDNLLVRMKYKEPNQKIDLKADLTIKLQKDLTNKLRKKISMIYYLIATNKQQEALELSLETTQSWPESYHANVLLGEIYEENGQLEEALTAYRKGILLFKNDEQDRIIEYPKGLWDKINDLEEKLK